MEFGVKRGGGLMQICDHSEDGGRLENKKKSGPVCGGLLLGLAA